VKPRRTSPSKSESCYLEKLRLYCQALSLAALGGEEGADAELRLEDVYIDLDTQTQIDKVKLPPNLCPQVQLVNKQKDASALQAKAK